MTTAHTPEPLVVHLQKPSPTRCGYTVALQRAGAGVDGLSYDTLHLRGHVLGRVTLALADEAAQRREENIPLAQVTGVIDLWLPLRAVARQLDMRAVVGWDQTSHSSMFPHAWTTAM